MRKGLLHVVAPRSMLDRTFFALGCLWLLHKLPNPSSLGMQLQVSALCNASASLVAKTKLTLTPNTTVIGTTTALLQLLHNINIAQTHNKD